MATQEAVDRRRLNRASRREEKDRRRIERERREAEVAVRVARRFFGDQPFYLIVIRYAYWQARRCGWDACSAEVRGRYRGADGQSHLYHPSESAFWLWWTKLHWKQRNQFVEISQLRVRQ